MAATKDAKSNDRDKDPELYKALADKDARVRREVANVLKINKDKRSIEALIARWKRSAAGSRLPGGVVESTAHW
jgi:HEAT repeat protein